MKGLFTLAHILGWGVEGSVLDSIQISQEGSSRPRRSCFSSLCHGWGDHLGRGMVTRRNARRSPAQTRPIFHKITWEERIYLRRFSIRIMDLISVNERNTFSWLVRLAYLHWIGQDLWKGNFCSINIDASAFSCLFLHHIHCIYVKVLAVGHNAKCGTALCVLSAILLFVHSTHVHSGSLYGMLLSCHLLFITTCLFSAFRGVCIDFSQQDWGEWEYFCYRCNVIYSLQLL